ncbi:Pyridinium-3 [Chlorella vulgaris]
MASLQCCSAPQTCNARVTPSRALSRRQVVLTNARAVRAAAGSNGAGTATMTTLNPQLLEVLQHVANGMLTPGDGAVQLSALVGQSKLSGPDSAVTSKAEFPEVVWGEHKTASQILNSLHRIAAQQGMAAATRVSPQVAEEVMALDPSVTFQAPARMLILKSATTKQQKLPGSVALICAGTADASVVEECRVMLSAAGCYAFKIAESGVMGMHRIVQNLDAVKAADVVICITGMDGGLASVVAGMVEVPVIALPTSTGYGAAFSGVAPMLAALNSSAPGVTVVNIDSGFGASMAAWRILKNASRIRQAAMGK